MPRDRAWATLVPTHGGTAVRAREGGTSLFTVIACVAFVVLGLVGAVKMEDHLEPHETRAPAER